MLPRPLHLRLQNQSGTSRYCYRFAGHSLHSALELPHLKGWRSEDSAGVRAPSLAAAGWAREIFSGSAFVGGRDRQLRCERSGAGATLTIEALGAYRLDFEGGVIQLLPPFPAAAEVEQALCGPCLALLLAHDGDYLLHASAVRTAIGVVALVGRSGAGKSTLAAGLVTGTPVEPLADDALPVRLRDDDIVVPGAYPQPKWPDWGAARRHDPAARLAAVVELVPDGTGPALERLDGAGALLAAAAHTVAARLFDAELLARHFRFGRELAARASWWRLRYPPQLRNLPSMVDRIRSLWNG